MICIRNEQMLIPSSSGPAGSPAAAVLRKAT